MIKTVPVIISQVTAVEVIDCAIKLAEGEGKSNLVRGLGVLRALTLDAEAARDVDRMNATAEELAKLLIA